MDGWEAWEGEGGRKRGGVEVERGIGFVEVEGGIGRGIEVEGERLRGKRERGRLTSSNDRHYRWERVHNQRKTRP